MQTITRKQAESILSGVRYPGCKQLIDRTTFWRWCNLAGVPSRLREFDSGQFHKLKRVAELTRMGYSYESIKNLIGVKPHDQHQQQQQDQQPQQAAAPWGGFDYSNPYG